MMQLDVRLVCKGEMRLCLSRRATLLLRQPGPARIGCLSGTLWLSRERSRLDTVLQAGQSLEIADARAVLASGLPEAEIEIATYWRKTHEP